jgi:hypothetical protein
MTAKCARLLVLYSARVTRLEARDRMLEADVRDGYEAVSTVLNAGTIPKRGISTCQAFGCCLEFLPEPKPTGTRSIDREYLIRYLSLLLMVWGVSQSLKFSNEPQKSQYHDRLILMGRLSLSYGMLRVLDVNANRLHLLLLSLQSLNTMLNYPLAYSDFLLRV